jgi:hypothetical protein
MSLTRQQVIERLSSGGDLSVDEAAGLSEELRGLYQELRPTGGLAELATETAPEGLRERVFETLEAAAKDEPRSSPRGRWWVAAAAVVALLLGLGGVFWADHAPVRRAERLVDLMVTDHLSYVNRSDRLQIASRDTTEVSGWLRTELGFAARALPLPGAQLEGARSCTLDDTNAGLLFYRLDDKEDPERIASLYVLEAPTADFSQMHPLEVPGKKGICRRHQLGLSAVSWNERGLTYVLVSELDDSELADLLDTI